MPARPPGFEVGGPSGAHAPAKHREDDDFSQAGQLYRLMSEAERARLEAVRILLAYGADPDLGNDRGQMPLAGAAFKGDVALAELLLDHGAAVDGHGGDGKTALM